MVLVVKIGDNEVRPAIFVHIAGINTHTGLCHARCIISDLCFGPYVLERPVLLVDQEQVG